MKQYLIIQTAFLGDAVLATALAEALHQQYPDAAIDILIRKGNEGIFKGHPFLRNILVWDKHNAKYKGLFSLLKTIRHAKYDAVINLQRFLSTGILTAFSSATDKIGFDKNPLSFLFTHTTKHVIGDGRHEVERNMELIKYLADAPAVRPKLYPQPEHIQSVGEYTAQPFVCMAPASVWFTKQLPEDKWVELIQKTPSSYQVYLIGGPADVSLCNSIKAKAGKHNVLVLAGKTNLLQTAALMQKASMNYVNDSGPLHIASAVNAPVTVYFCSTIPAFGFGPLSDKSTTVEVHEALECRPCGLHGKKACPKGHFKCAYHIEIKSQVL